MLDVLQKIFSYGCLGLLVEVFFTGAVSLYRRNWRATSQTYLWMLPIYGIGGVTLEAIQTTLNWHWFAMAFVYVPLIYAFEFVSGWTLKRIIGRCPWDYGSTRYSVMGLIRLDYAPLWLLVAMLFYPVSIGLTQVLKVLPTTLLAAAGGH